MSVRRGWVAVVVASVLLLATGCAQGGTGIDPVPPREYPAGELVLRVEVIGGFLPPDAYLSELPVLSVYGDGRVITQGATPAIFPAPALPAVMLQHISTDNVSRLVDLAVAAGVGRDADYGQPPIADAPSTRFTVAADGLASGSTPSSPGPGKPLVSTVNALGISTGGNDGLSPGQRTARNRLATLYDQLTNLAKTLGAGALDSPVAYVPESLAAITSSWYDPGDANLPAPPEVAWPGPALPGETVGRGLGITCVTTTGATTATVLAAAAKANRLTPWTYGGQRWSIALRPLLPDESACADLLH